MGFPKFLTFCCERSMRVEPSEGITVDFIKRRKVLKISGWYDTIVGMGSEEITLGKFLNGLGITLKDCEKALKD